MVKNVKSKCNFLVYQLSGLELSDDVVAKGQEYLFAKKSEDREKADALKAELVASYNDKQKAVIKEYDAETHVDVITTEIDLGHFLYDIFVNTVEMPKAPLSLQLMHKKMQSFAETLSQDEFEIPKDVFNAVKTAMASDDTWEKLSFVVWWNDPKSEDGKVKKYQNINTSGIYFFRDVLTAAVDVFSKEEELSAS